jgi:hypothetical protein
VRFRRTIGGIVLLVLTAPLAGFLGVADHGSERDDHAHGRGEHRHGPSPIASGDRTPMPVHGHAHDASTPLHSHEGESTIAVAKSGWTTFGSPVLRALADGALSVLVPVHLRRRVVSDHDPPERPPRRTVLRI